jgi:hypothetical protein
VAKEVCDRCILAEQASERDLLDPETAVPAITDSPSPDQAKNNGAVSARDNLSGT